MWILYYYKVNSDSYAEWSTEFMKSQTLSQLSDLTSSFVFISETLYILHVE